MSTTRAGDPTATQSPSAPPTPGAVPTQTLPADGDPLTAASVAQPFKVSADFNAWQMSPRAQAAAGTGASNWAQAIVAYLNSRLQARFVVDHLGFPAGKFIKWQEDWGDTSMKTTLSTLGTSQVFGGRWLGSLGGSNPSLATTDLSSTGQRTAVLTLAGATVSLDVVRAFPYLTPVASDADTAMVMQWDAIPAAGTLSGNEFAMGFAARSFCIGAVSARFSTTAPDACGFLKRTGDANWQVYTKHGGSALITDTGVAAAIGTPVRFRVEIVGANAGDDSTARALFYVNGVFKGAVAVATPTNPMPFFEFSTNLNVTNSLQVGVVDFMANIWPGNIVF